MIYGVEQSTDLRYLQTKIKKFTSKRRALEWAKGGGYFTHSDPEAARNWHHTLRSVYVVRGVRRPPRKQLEQLATEYSTPTYPRNADDMLASWIHKNGERID